MNKVRLTGQCFQKLIDQKVLNHSATHLRLFRCGDISPRDNPRFPVCTDVLFDHCDKNFVFYWLNTHIFPTVENVWIFSTHPCQKEIHLRFMKDWGQKVPNFYVDPEYIHYFKVTSGNHHAIPPVIFIPKSEERPAIFV